MSEILLSADALVVPTYIPGKALTFDMRRIHKAEGRLHELNFVNKARAGELFHTFIEAFGDARTVLASVRAEYGRMKHKLRQIKAVLIIDKMPEIMKAKGLGTKTNEDQREGIVSLDPEYTEALHELGRVEAVVEGMEGKVEKLKMAYYALSDMVKGPDISRRDTSGGTGSDEPGALTESEKLQRFVQEHSGDADEHVPGFGRAKY